jgi:uncharacterized protein YdeI (YjbR/CyaY-like superfamily)
VRDWLGVAPGSDNHFAAIPHPMAFGAVAACRPGGRFVRVGGSGRLRPKRMPPYARRVQHHPDVDAYLASSDLWPDVVRALRPLLSGCGLTEEIKWGKPCYSHEGRNILILQEMNRFLAMMFFKGALLSDPDGVLENQGPNSRSAKRICFTSVADVDRLTPTVRAYVAEAIAVEDAGLAVDPAPEPELVAELRERLADDAALRSGFESLTPGRRREYHLHFSDAKQSSTRIARIDKYADRIRAGKGLRDR